jgi:hypothetical protein
VLVKELNAGGLPVVNFSQTNVNGNTAGGIAPAPGQPWTSGRGGGVAMVGALSVDADATTCVTGNKQSAPAPTTLPFKLGVYLDPALAWDGFSLWANVNNNTQL